MPVDTQTFLNAKSVRADWIDLRDQNYVPNLSILRESVSLHPGLMSQDPVTGVRTLGFGVRHQGETGRCVGFALANLVDIQRNLQALRVETLADRDMQRAGNPEDVPQPISEEERLLKMREDIVSADMMYRMAFFHDRYPDLESQIDPSSEGIRTLRSAIKGFYHHGVCQDWPKAEAAQNPAFWQSSSYNPASADANRLFPTVDQAKAARRVGLGAYFRLAPVLNHFHAALNDAQAILVTANIHDGWGEPTLSNGGVIQFPPDKGVFGTHAFVITGYDDQGFHVLNSWGPEWGGYNKQAGIALWQYADWARNVVDAWVLRLGVFAPKAFGASIGEKGIQGATGRIQSGSTPCSELVGHYMHLDDGFQVSTGSYPSFKDGWGLTKDYLEADFKAVKDPDAAPRASDHPPYKGVMVWIPGSLEGIKDAFDAAVRRKEAIKALGLYPYTVFWCNIFVEKSLEVLHGLFDSCEEQAGEKAEHLDDLIEARVRGVGRAFWRDIEMGARRAVRGSGELPYEDDEPWQKDRVTEGFAKRLILDLIDLRRRTGCEVHVVAEGAGALMVHDILFALKQDAQDAAKEAEQKGKEVPDYPFDWRTHDIFDSLHLIHPAIGNLRSEKVLIPYFRKTNGVIKGKVRDPSQARSPNIKSVIKSDKPRPARIYLPSPDLENRVRFGQYGKSILHLVSRAFEDRYLTPRASEQSKDPVAKVAVEAARVAQGKTDQQVDAGELNVPVFGKPRTFLGMAENADDNGFKLHGSLFQLNTIAGNAEEHQPLTQADLNRDETITQDIFKTIQGLRAQKSQSKKGD